MLPLRDSQIASFLQRHTESAPYPQFRYHLADSSLIPASQERLVLSFRANP